MSGGLAGLLSGKLAAQLGRALGPQLFPVTIHQRQPGGTYADLSGARGIKVEFTLAQRSQYDIPLGNVQIIVLRFGAPAELTLDSHVTVRGVRYAVIGPIDIDEAMAAWVFQAKPWET